MADSELFENLRLSKVLEYNHYRLFVFSLSLSIRQGSPHVVGGDEQYPSKLTINVEGLWMMLAYRRQ